ncbi:hypothetical protein BGX24_011061 [Mortierella sp. AD032]|nr:hypothetical protein BGX24_011061 [Mortierella sp. AD032]
MSTPIQNNQPPCPDPPAYSSLGHSELTTEGGRGQSQLEQTAALGHMSSKSGSIPSNTQGLVDTQPGPTNLLNPHGHHVVGSSVHESDAESSEKLSVKQRLSAFMDRDHNVALRRVTRYLEALGSITR